MNIVVTSRTKANSMRYFKRHVSFVQWIIDLKVIAPRNFKLRAIFGKNRGKKKAKRKYTALMVSVTFKLSGTGPPAVRTQ
jgi:hypothetical protein